MSGDSHTNFNSGGFSAGAAAGSLTVAGAFVGALQAAAQLNARRWESWNREQLETALDLSEELRRHAYEEREELRVENAKLLMAMRRVAMRRASAR
ncbi:hypothetical protein [Bradyrhizobium sp. B117]|uniref:hypothetical protein n=1 Tax=Bradyrhizobium sp. B117 TaxID=3140246 RepID=UPI003184373C